MEKPNFEKEKKPFLEVTISAHGMPCIAIENPTPEIREMIKNAVQANRINDLDYELRTKAGAFLQSDQESYILVEFWQKDYQSFVDYLNQLIAKEKP